MPTEFEKDMVDRLHADLRAAGVSASDVDEVARYLLNVPDSVAVAVIGEHNVGKTTLIAALTGDPDAHADIAPVIKTDRSRRYITIRSGLEIEIWDTPGLGTERWEHDADVRDRITRADAVVVAVTTELLDDLAREQLRHLVVVGRKLGVTLFVMTKSDREAVDRDEALEELRQALAPVPPSAIEPVWTSAKQVVGGGASAETARGAGIEMLDSRIVQLATGSAQERMRIRGAIRALDLIDRALPALVDERQPELRLAIELQQRLHRLLVEADKKVGRIADRYRNELRMRGADVSAQFGYDLAELIGASTVSLNDEIEVAWRGRWQEFNDAISALSDEFATDIATVVADAATECDHLNQSLLAQELRSRLPVLVEEEGQDHGSSPGHIDQRWRRPGYADTLKSVIDGIGKTADVFLDVEGLESPFASVADLGQSLVDLVFSLKEEQDVTQRLAQADELKRESRSRLNERADRVISGWNQALARYRAESVSANAARASETEASLHRALGTEVALAERLRAARAELEAAIPEEAWAPAATEQERSRS
ncbi:Rab family GTPase [Candidatus Solirubrobacter pratensis]|uniref:Rab family GTPase n=1 Tax=Candidatus Solirubrobacter pratensis TaxID=1298857 RepID=UPI00048769D3|nr:GTPase domain-containing protein [Candidatus Solirubrobacter pratensis]